MGHRLFSLWTLVQVQAYWKMSSAIPERLLHVCSEGSSRTPHYMPSARMVLSGGDARVGLGPRPSRRNARWTFLHCFSTVGHYGRLVVSCVFGYRRCPHCRAIYQRAVAERSIHTHHRKSLWGSLVDTSFEPSRGAVSDRSFSSPEHRNCGLWPIGLRRNCQYLQGWVRC